MKLFKRQDRYDLYADTDHKVASSAPNPFGKLSKENCDEIFGVVDVEKLAELDYRIGLEEYIPTPATHIQSFKSGFNKAMELNKDKVFTLEDMNNAMNRVWDWCEDEKDTDCSSMTELREKHIQFIQQPTEIEVTFNPDEKDSDGCLILSKL
jgi:hypothetical protein